MVAITGALREGQGLTSLDISGNQIKSDTTAASVAGAYCPVKIRFKLSAVGITGLMGE